MFIISVSSFALLDAAGVFVYYNVTIGEELFLQLGATYYAIYTAAIIISLGLFRYLDYKDEYKLSGLDEAIAETDIQELRAKFDTLYKQQNNNIHVVHKENTAIHDTALNPNQVLIEKVLHLLNVKELTQIEVADIVGLSQPQISRIYNKSKKDLDV